MPKRSSKLPRDPNQLAARIVATSTGQEPPAQTETLPPAKEKNPAAVALGKLGGMKGGKARAEKLTPEDRARIASQAAKSRWAKKPQGSSNKS